MIGCLKKESHASSELEKDKYLLRGKTDKSGFSA